MCETLDRLGFTISIHALREEGDTKTVSRNVTALRFLSTPSARRATSSLATTVKIELFLSTPSARRATDLGLVEEQLRGISIHALREEGDLLSMGIVPGMCLFLSTPSARRATNGARACLPPKRFLSTPSARRATRHRQAGSDSWTISIHALREEGDRSVAFSLSVRSDFYPRPPRGGRRHRDHANPRGLRISIHALREEGDCSINFYSTTVILFLSTPSARRATC